MEVAPTVDTNPTDYSKCRIVNIRRGEKSKGRDIWIYAHLVDEKGNIVICATLDYIVKALDERLPEVP
jgi:hypothetical protein